MAPGLDEYEPFFDQIRAAHKQLDDAQAGWTWAAAWDPIAEHSQWQRVEQARAQYRYAVEQLVAYVLH